MSFASILLTHSSLQSSVRRINRFHDSHEADVVQRGDAACRHGHRLLSVQQHYHHSLGVRLIKPFPFTIVHRLFEQLTGIDDSLPSETVHADLHQSKRYLHVRIFKSSEQFCNQCNY
ncbi:unnamed protein product [Chrysodeixis includens]|uniref:Uncharacterized protein n=1 Tax=Chrysodeixis includens TaxID=689277 RepID=A0A9N8Q187_CHRIL|nr:unnamed protein product [Chrysodeixis includens]